MKSEELAYKPQNTANMWNKILLLLIKNKIPKLNIFLVLFLGFIEMGHFFL